MEKGIGKFTTSKAVILNRPSEVDPNVSYVVVSYDAFRRDPEGFMRTVQPDTVIADEFHRAANPQSLTHQAIKKVRPEVKHFMGLTASVVQNQPEEIASLMSLAAGPQAPFRSPEEFRKRYVKRVQEPGSGVFGGKVYGKRIVREEELVKRVGPTVHYVEDLDASEKPTKMVETVPVQMSPAQVDLYRMSMKGVDPKIVAKIQAGEPVSQKEAMGIFARLIRARQVSNSMHVVDPRLTPEQAAEITPKIQKVLGDAQEHISGREDAQVIMYTNIVHGGVDVLEAGLKKAGIPYATFIGRGNPGVTEESRQQAVRDYISGKVKVIVITGAGAEGLDLPNTTMVQMVDGHYNPERINQAEARGVRAGGLAHLPPEERKVQVRRYVSTLPRGFWRTILFRPPERSVEEFVYSTAQRKEKATRQLRDILARRSEHEQKRRESTAYRWFGGGP
jgi:SNF2 family DNA or RNA helicase